MFSPRRKTEPSLRPVRWPRPRRTSLLRLSILTALLTAAAYLAWTGLDPCRCPP